MANSMTLKAEREVTRVGTVGIVLGSEIIKKGKRLVPGESTQLRIEAAAIAFKKDLVQKLLICGGYSFGVRHGLHGTMEKPNFSFEAIARAQWTASEARIIARYLKKQGVPVNAMILEENSLTTQENALFAEIILRRTTFDEIEKIGIITNLYHMRKALKCFKMLKRKVFPLFAEDLLATKGKRSIDKIYHFYNVPRGGKQWPAEEIRKLLLSGKSVAELLECDHDECSEEFKKDFAGQQLVQIFKNFKFKESKIVDRIINEARNGKGYLRLFFRKCLSCGEEEVTRGWLVLRDEEYRILKEGESYSILPF